MIPEVFIIKDQHTHLVFVMVNSRMTAVQDLAITQTLRYTEMAVTEHLIIHYMADKGIQQCSKFQAPEPTAQKMQAQQLNLGMLLTVLEQDINTGKQIIHLVGIF
jgi:hypothetical protein